MIDIEYNEAYQDFLEVLTEMKRSIERYESKDNHNPEWVASRKENLAVIYQYSKIAHRTASILQEQVSQAYGEGYRRGVESVERMNNNTESTQEMRARLGNDNYRNYHNNIQITKWADLFFSIHEQKKH